MFQFRDGTLCCVFVTDEDRPKPDIPATSILDEDVKAVYSFDNGKSWSKILKPLLVSILVIYRELWN